MKAWLFMVCLFLMNSVVPAEAQKRAIFEPSNLHGLNGFSVSLGGESQGCAPMLSDVKTRLLFILQQQPKIRIIRFAQPISFNGPTLEIGQIDICGSGGHIGDTEIHFNVWAPVRILASGTVIPAVVWESGTIFSVEDTADLANKLEDAFREFVVDWTGANR